MESVCFDFVFSTMTNSILCEGGEPIFMDVSYEDWSMDLELLEIVFQRCLDVKLILMNHAYRFPGQILKIPEI